MSSANHQLKTFEKRTSGSVNSGPGSVASFSTPQVKQGYLFPYANLCAVPSLKSVALLLKDGSICHKLDL